jgi:creatinine amidohydrolase
VLPLDKAGAGKAKKFSVEALNRHWAWTERQWTRTTSDTGIGDPRHASKEKGERYFKAVTQELAKLMVGLATTDENELYI